MHQRLASADLSLEELLSGRFAFTIPAYQRDYAWGREEALQLVADIAGVLEDAGREGAATPYFLGTMLFVERQAIGNPDEPLLVRPVDVVDGQQRLITLTIMLAVLRDIASGDQAAALDVLLTGSDAGDPRSHQLGLRQADAEFFATAIQEAGATRRGQPAKAIGDSVARRNVETVRKAFRRTFMETYDEAGRRAFAAFARRHVRVLVVSSDDFDYAYQIFLTINDRGKRLSVEDIFRGEILGPLDHAQRIRYGAVVDEMDKYMEAGEKSRSKGKTFFSHLAAIAGWRNRAIIDSLKRAVQLRGGPRRFASEVFEPMAEAYLQIKGSPLAAPLAPPIENRLTLLRWLEQHGDDDWIAPAMLGIVTLRADPIGLAAFLDALDRFAHGLLLMGCGKDARRKLYGPILAQLGTGVPFPAPDTLFQLKPKDQAEILRVVARRVHKLDAPAARLVLVRADLAISGGTTADYAALLSPDRPAAARFTVEHVCPKGELTGGEWTVLFPDKRRRFAAAQCIGNLALVSEAQNKAMDQHEFARKKTVLFQDADPVPFGLTEMLRHEATWDAEAIERRYLLIMETVRRMWLLDGPIPKCPAVTLAS